MSAAKPKRKSPPVRPIVERFEEKFIRCPMSGCWLWTEHANRAGYGVFYPRTGEAWLAHRYSWFLVNGPIPDGMLVCHRCDMPACINPAHLFLGTDQDNSDDKIRKSRMRRGSSRTNAKLRESDVVAVLADQRTHVQIARELGIAPSTISDIKRGKRWRHVGI